MRSFYIGIGALAVSASALSLALGCDLRKSEGVDAAAIVTATPPATPATVSPPAPGDPATAAPLGSTTAAPTATTTVHPVADGGVHPAADGGAPAPHPTLAIPTALPGFDAGAFKPPAGFPTTIPTFTPPK